MRRRDMIELGIPSGDVPVAARCLQIAAQQAGPKGLKKSVVRRRLRAVLENPEAFATTDDPLADLAQALIDRRDARDHFQERPEPAPYRQWGEDLDEKSVRQMVNACRLPVAVQGALMPDAHLGYGLPIGGILSTRNAVIPYAVGVDIACRMKLTVLDLPVSALGGQVDRLAKTLERETRFGIGARFRQPHDHEVMDEDWTLSPITRRVKDTAWAQLGSSGSGNHFVEFGVLTIDEQQRAARRAEEGRLQAAPEAGAAEAAAPAGGSSRFGLEPGSYLALLSHSGSRGAGANVAKHYSRLAMDLHPELPKELKHLAWLDLDSEAGQEYWRAMNLMGRYAAANHALIHRSIAKALKVDVLADVENHHNFAWKEIHGGEEVIVHRKGATPAGRGVLGVIPGSMATPAFVVQGRGEAESLRSASHGAGRLMSRKKAKNSFTWSETKKLLAERRVQLLSAGLDEVPMAYKDIHSVMAAQQDLVDIVGRFEPRLVKMAPPGERPED
ncbi:MAG: RtcB family protein [Acidobacteriota bacterium]